MKFTGAIFDMDGTLLDSMPLWDGIGGAFLKARGLLEPPGMRETLKSLGMIETAEYLRERFSLPDTPQSIIKELNGMVETGYFETAPAKRDIVPFLAKLREAGVAMCVATATDRYLAEAALRRLGLLDFFAFLLTCTEVGAGKDRPDIFETAAGRLGVARQDTVVFEDALHAIQTAKAAGFRVVAIQEDSCVEDEAAIRAAADQFIFQYAEVPLWQK